MQPPPFSADDLSLVLAISERRTLAGAAARLAVDASTVFRRLGALEGRLGVKLFERHRAGYSPTEAGEELVALAGRMEDEIAAVSRRLAGRAAVPAGEVRVTTNDTLLVHLLTPILADFRRRHPAVRLDIILANEALNLSRRDADIAVRVTPTPPETLVGRRVASLGWALYRAASEPEVAPSDAAWVALGDSLDTVAPARFVRRQVPPERIVYKVNTVLALVDAVAAGIGIGPLPCYVADCRDDLVRMAEPEPDLAGSLWLLTHPDLRNAPRVRLLLDHLAAAIAKERGRLAGERG